MLDSDTAWVQLHSRPKGVRVFRDLVARTSGRLEAGQQVALLDREEQVIGWGLYHPHSTIQVRLVRRGPQPFDDAWWRERALDAVKRREQTPGVTDNTDAYRVIHAEGDDFPGLVVDRFGDVLSAEAYTATMVPVFDAIISTLQEALGTKHWQLVYGARVAKAEREEPISLQSTDCPERVKIQEHDVRYEVRLDGHKTGFFCDQRDNRLKARALGEGRRVLDVCCYSGGFGLNALAGGATEVTGIDLDESAISMAKRNADLNSARAKFAQADAFSYLRTLQRNEERYGLVVLDPPKFVPGRHDWDKGIARYHDLNKLAMPLVEPGGWLVTCSCSGLVTPTEFLEVLRRAARVAGRTFRVVSTSGAAADHPVRLDSLEGSYLKVVCMQATDDGR